MSFEVGEPGQVGEPLQAHVSAQRVAPFLRPGIDKQVGVAFGVIAAHGSRNACFQRQRPAPLRVQGVGIAQRHIVAVIGGVRRRKVGYRAGVFQGDIQHARVASQRKALVHRRLFGVRPRGSLYVQRRFPPDGVYLEYAVREVAVLHRGHAGYNLHRGDIGRGHRARVHPVEGAYRGVGIKGGVTRQPHAVHLYGRAERRISALAACAAHRQVLGVAGGEVQGAVGLAARQQAHGVGHVEHLQVFEAGAVNHVRRGGLVPAGACGDNHLVEQEVIFRQFHHQRRNVGIDRHLYLPLRVAQRRHRKRDLARRHILQQKRALLIGHRPAFPAAHNHRRKFHRLLPVRVYHLPRHRMLSEHRRRGAQQNQDKYCTGFIHGDKGIYLPHERQSLLIMKSLRNSTYM